jgi:type II secretion system protein J
MATIMNRKSGFTLIELFIAISIFAVVAIALYSTFFAGISVWRRSGKGGDIYHNIRIVFDDMTKELRNTINMYANVEDIKTIEEEGESSYAFSGGPDEIAFITLEGPFLEDDIHQKELVKVIYRFDRTAGELIRVIADKPIGFDIEKGKKEVILSNVENFKFEYCYGLDDEFEPYLWKEEWEDEEMRIPRGVRVTFNIKTERIKKPLEFSKTIFVPTGVLGEEEEVGL